MLADIKQQLRHPLLTGDEPLIRSNLDMSISRCLRDSG